MQNLQHRSNPSTCFHRTQVRCRVWNKENRVNSGGANEEPGKWRTNKNTQQGRWSKISITTITEVKGEQSHYHLYAQHAVSRDGFVASEHPHQQKDWAPDEQKMTHIQRIGADKWPGKDPAATGDNRITCTCSSTAPSWRRRKNTRANVRVLAPPSSAKARMLSTPIMRRTGGAASNTLVAHGNRTGAQWFVAIRM